MVLKWQKWPRLHKHNVGNSGSCITQLTSFASSVTVVPNTQPEPPLLIGSRTETFFLLFLSNPLQFGVSFCTRGKTVKDFLNGFKVVRSLEPHIQLTKSVVVFVVPLLSHVRLCDPMDRSTPGFPVLHCLLEFAQSQVHWVGDTIQPSHPLSPTPHQSGQLINDENMAWYPHSNLSETWHFFLVGWRCSSRQMPLFCYKFGAKVIEWPSYSSTAQKLTHSLRAAR